MGDYDVGITKLPEELRAPPPRPVISKVPGMRASRVPITVIDERRMVRFRGTVPEYIEARRRGARPPFPRGVLWRIADDGHLVPFASEQMLREGDVVVYGADSEEPVAVLPERAFDALFEVSAAPPKPAQRARPDSVWYSFECFACFEENRSPDGVVFDLRTSGVRPETAKCPLCGGECSLKAVWKAGDGGYGSRGDLDARAADKEACQQFVLRPGDRGGMQGITCDRCGRTPAAHE